jgi:hypothetical protein
VEGTRRNVRKRGPPSHLGFLVYSSQLE